MSNTVIGYGKTFFEPGDTSDPMIEAIVTPVDDAEKAKIEDSTILKINVKDIFQIRPGTIFEQSPSTSEDATRIKKISIEFDTRDCILDRLGNIEEISSWFDRSNNEAFQQLKLMYVVKGRTTHREIFLVPCPVIILYYLPHTKLLQAALSGQPLEQNYNLFDPDRTNWNKDVPSVHMRYGATFKIARHLAKFIIDKQVAGRAFHQIHPRSMHVFNQNESQQEPSLYMNIPAVGALKWKAKVFETSRLIWVTQIVDCTSPAPFRDLLVTKDSKTYLNTRTKHVDKPRKQARTDDKDIIFVPGQKTDIALETIELTDSDEHISYSGLDQSKVKLVTKIHYRLPDKTIITTEEPIGPLRLGTGNPSPDGKDVTPVEYTSNEKMPYEKADDEQQTTPQTESAFEAAIKLLSTDHKELSLIQLSKTTPLTPPLNSNIIPFSTKANKTPWCRRYIVKGETKEEVLNNWQLSARRFFLARFICHGRHLYIVEFILDETASDNSSILAFGDADNPSEEDILREIMDYAVSRSMWPTSLDESLVFFRFRSKKRHPFIKVKTPKDAGNSGNTQNPHTLLMAKKLSNIIHEFERHVGK